MRGRQKALIYAALLSALAVIIPIQFGFLKVYIPPFSATLAAHVPMFIAMLISPLVAIIVGIASTLGFLLSGMPMPVVFRAATHIIVGFIGAKMIEKNMSFIKASVFTSLLHGGLEALVVIPFVGFDIYQLLIVTGVGAIIHHLADASITYGIIKSVASARRKTIYTLFDEVKEKKLRV